MIGLPTTRVGLDAGTANTLLYVKDRGVAVNEPSLVTFRRSSGDIEGVGGEAEAGRGRTPRKLQTARPIRAGVIRDVTLFDGMLRRFLRKARISGPLHCLKIAIAVPSGITEVGRLAIIDSVRKAGAEDVLCVNQVLAAARGTGLAIQEARGRMVVNIGAGTTEVAIISLGNTAYSRTIPVAGEEMDAAISAHVSATHQLIIGEPTAERIKVEIGSAVCSNDELTLAVKGRCVVEGIPRQASVRGGEVREAISPILERIANLIREALEQAPPELSADLIETGIMLTGGSALLRNLDQFISRRCRLNVKVAQDPLLSVIQGLAYQLNELPRINWRRFANGCQTDCHF